MPRRPHTSPFDFTKGRPRMDVNTVGENGIGQGGARSLTYYLGGQEDMRNVPYDQAGQNGARNLPYDRNEHRTTMGREDPRDTYLSWYDARNNIPRDTVPDIDMRSARDMIAQKFRDMALRVSQLASEVQLLKSNPTPPATAADNDSLSTTTPDVVSHPPAAVAVPLPIPPVVPIGEPIHYASGSRPKLPNTVTFENYAGQGAPF